MDIRQKKIVFSGALLFTLPFLCSSPVFAAKQVNLRQQNISTLAVLTHSFTAANIQLEETKRNLDLNHTLHVRVQEKYKGYPVLGADTVIHIPNGINVQKSMTSVTALAIKNNGSMNGMIYQNLDTDLAGAPPIIFNQEQARKALQQAMQAYQKEVHGQINFKDKSSDLVVYIEDNKAHWAYKVSFFVEPYKVNMTPEKLIYIMDALTFKIYQKWNDIKTDLKTVTLDKIGSFGGGLGGNKKMGQLVYDGLTDHLPRLNILWDSDSKICYWQNKDVTVKNYRGGRIMTFSCKVTDSDHNDVYWIGNIDAVNDGFSPSDDALFGGMVIKNMYQDWYGVPVLKNSDGTPMMLNMVVHVPNYDNAYWDGRQMTFGDGYSMFYPLTSLGVAAHEISHGFTEQHSDLAYYSQSGGMNEAFSDMAAQAAEFYAYKKNSWQIGPEIFKAADRALRYMDMPSKDCKGKTPGSRCSIDSADQYREGIDVHYSSGVYNRFFYTLGTTKNWDPRKAFDVMVKANSDYWTSRTTFSEGACGVISAAQDLGYDIEAVKKAFSIVKVNINKC